MIERLAEFFWHQQYGIQNTNFENVRVLYKAEAQDVRVIVIFDLDVEVRFTPEQCLHIVDQVEKAYYQKGYLRVELLSLLCTRELEVAKPYCQSSQYSQWVVDTLNNRLVVFENQPMSFGNVRNLLDNLLIGQYHRVNPEFTEPVFKKGDGFVGTRNGVFPNGSLRNWLKGKPVCTMTLIVINVVILILMKITESKLRIPSIWGTILSDQAEIQNYINWGATSYSDIVEGHQYFRLFTAMFLHAGFEHLFNNMLVLAVVGYMLETNFGSIRFLIIYLTAGLLANVGSFFYFN